MIKTMKKENYVTTSQLITLAKKHSGLSKEVLSDSLHALLAAVTECVDDGKIVTIDSFGRFDTRLEKEHTVTPPPPHNMPVTIPAHKVVRFKAYQNFLTYYMKY
jgi:nucleoid DNA-binding protein